MRSTRGQAARPGRKNHLAGHKTQRHALTIKRQIEAASEFRPARPDKARDRGICHIGGDITLLQLLVRWDFRQVDNVGHPNPIAPEHDF